MLDQSDYLLPIKDWQQALSRGDIVRFRFPIRKPRTSGERPKLRPCLVLELFDVAGSRFATLAYGTSTDTRANRGREVFVTHPDALAEAGLEKPTRFVCARLISVSLDHPGFEIEPPATTPVIGRLDNALTERMNAVRARLHAEADIAAEAREQRRREQEAWRREARGFRERNRALLGDGAFSKNGDHA